MGNTWTHSPEYILLKMKQLQYCYEQIGTEESLAPLTSPAYGTEYLVHQGLDPEPV